MTRKRPTSRHTRTPDSRHRYDPPNVVAGRRSGTYSMATAESSSGASAARDVVARIERLPISTWHLKVRVIVGAPTFFDAFDALAIATVLPAIVPLWRLNPQQIGLLISAGFLGQLIGALVFGWISERYGRITA